MSDEEPRLVRTNCPDCGNMLCPKCGGHLIFGFGLAGGGMGSYAFCDNENCDFADKEYEHEEE